MTKQGAVQMIIHRRTIFGLMAAPAILSSAQAQDFPTQALRLIPPYPPGGGTDTVARLLLPHLISQLGQNIVVENHRLPIERKAEA